MSTYMPIIGESAFVQLISPFRLLPSEEHLPERLDEVAVIIQAEKRWTAPIVVERQSLVVMDGHHRLAFARRERLRIVPCLLCDYAVVTVEARRFDFVVKPEEVIRRGLSGALYPPKTTRHHIPDWLTFRYSVPLDELR